jgi:hypothetical protein
MRLGYSRTPLRRKLVEAILQDAKTATAKLVVAERFRLVERL